MQARAKANRLKTEDKKQVLDDQKRNEIFLREGIPLWVACLGKGADLIAKLLCRVTIIL
ncbi:hypothetical protein OIU77_000746 [Salix suchowensis]|uniref:Uncharacterized protein n=1 Tax=Salix suchowensis TaxID=1278906 RepID=A0ABQ9B8L5_9ROSI|nr:hypothetical protein OIU77_000746 [Salix suchowensis]